jgi:Flp pilus assembly protein TadB
MHNTLKYLQKQIAKLATVGAVVLASSNAQATWGAPGEFYLVKALTSTTSLTVCILMFFLAVAGLIYLQKDSAAARSRAQDIMKNEINHIMDSVSASAAKASADPAQHRQTMIEMRGDVDKLVNEAQKDLDAGNHDFFTHFLAVILVSTIFVFGVNIFEKDILMRISQTSLERS